MHWSIEDQLQEELQIYDAQVSGKQPKLISKSGKYIFKGYNAIEDQFYKYIMSLSVNALESAILPFLPGYHGVFTLPSSPKLKAVSSHDRSSSQWLQHLSSRYQKRNNQNKFIILNNITNGYKKINVLDIKVGGRNQEKKHKITAVVSKYYLKLNGCTINSTDTIFMSKYHLHSILTKQDILLHLALFFLSSVEIIPSFIELLTKLILAFRCVRSHKFISSSVCMFYDAQNPTSHALKFIDFGRCATHPVENTDYDREACAGLENLLQFLTEISQRWDQLKDKVMQLKETYKNQQRVIIPNDKKIKYQQ